MPGCWAASRTTPSPGFRNGAACESPREGLPDRLPAPPGLSCGWSAVVGDLIRLWDVDRSGAPDRDRLAEGERDPVRGTRERDVVSEVDDPR